MAKIVTTINGRFVKPGEAKISVFDNSVMYAEGLFETFLGIGEEVVFENDHIARLWKGARLIGLEMPISKKTLREWMHKTLSRHPGHVKKLRLTVTCGLSRKWFDKPGKPQVILSVGPHDLPEKPFRLRVSPYRLDEQSVFRRIKTLSYAIHAVSFKKAQEKGYDDALLLNNKGQVAEVSSANVFWVKNGRVCTTPLSSGCLDGTVRRVVLRESKRLGYRVTEKNIRLETLLKADELFLSSSLKLAIPISVIRANKKTHKFPAGPIGKEVADRFRDLIGLPPLWTDS